MEKPTNIVPIEKLEIGMRVRILKGLFKNDTFRIMNIDTIEQKIITTIGFVHFCDQGTGWMVAEQRPQPKTPHQIKMPIAKVHQETSHELLELELDYELASLHDAMKQDDQPEIKRSKQRLAEIHKELESSK